MTALSLLLALSVPGNVDGAHPLQPVAEPVYHRTTYIPPPPQPTWQPGPPDVDGSFAPGLANVGLLDNFVFFVGLDGSKAPEDLGVNANFGTRVGFNWGVPLIESHGVGFQVGVAENFHNNAIRGLKFVDGTTERYQTWVTLGLFQRTDVGFNWGAVYDFRFDDYYEHFTTGQWRGQVGLNLGPNDEVGLWGSLRMQCDDVDPAGIALHLRPMNQLAFFWRHVWPGNAVTRTWVGFTDSHGKFVLFNPPESPTNTPVMFGADVFVPLNEYVALWGEANFITPNDTGTVTAFLGLAITPGTSQLLGRSRFAPYLPTANNVSFSLDAR